VDSKLSVNVSAQTGKKANMYFVHPIHLRRDTFNASLQQRKEEQTKETNKEEKETSFHTARCVSAAKASLLLEGTPVSSEHSTLWRTITA